MIRKFLSLVFVLCCFVSFAKAQTAEITIQLNEQFFDALVEAIFKYSNPPEFPLAMNEKQDGNSVGSFINAFFSLDEKENTACRESIKLQRQVDGVNTAVRFRDGRIYAPIAFTGNYNPPLVGCVDFSGVAETNIDLEFNKETQTLTGRAKVLNINLSGSRGVGGGLVARMVQSSIDKKVNPINILQMDKVSFVVPIQNSGNIRMKAVGMRHEILNGALNVHIAYEFQKAE